MKFCQVGYLETVGISFMDLFRKFQYYERNFVEECWTFIKMNCNNERFDYWFYFSHTCSRSFFKTYASLRLPLLYNIYLMSYYGNVCFCSGDGFSLRGRTTSRRSILPGDRDDGECSFILYNSCSAYIYLIYHSHRNYYTASTQLHLH